MTNTNGPRIGSLFSGAGALDQGVIAELGGSVAWHIEYDEAPAKVLDYHWPTIPNYGDVTQIDWASVPAIDGLVGGYPCQPFSSMGNREGKNDPRHLWPYFAAAIRELRPDFAILENVAGHLSLGFDIVLGELAQIGYDTEWVCLPASAAGAPHKRERIFVVAHPANESRWKRYGIDLQARRNSLKQGSSARPGSYADSNHLGSDGRWGSRHGGLESSYARVPDVVWGKHVEAINHWESVVGRHAPWPGHVGGGVTTEFTEWQMGWPYGLVTDPRLELSREQQAHIIGNGVVPQQAALAIRYLLRTELT